MQKKWYLFLKTDFKDGGKEGRRKEGEKRRCKRDTLTRCLLSVPLWEMETTT